MDRTLLAGTLTVNSHVYAVTSHLTRTYHLKPTDGSKLTCYGGRRKIFWEMCYLLQGLESEGMGLPRDVSSGATCVGFTAAHHCALPIPTILRHTPTMHRGVKADVRSGRWGGWLASSSWGDVPPSPLPCSCSHRRQLSLAHRDVCSRI